MKGLPEWKKSTTISTAVWIQCTTMTDRQTYRRQQIPSLRIASRGKNSEKESNNRIYTFCVDIKIQNLAATSKLHSLPAHIVTACNQPCYVYHLRCVGRQIKCRSQPIAMSYGSRVHCITQSRWFGRHADGDRVVQVHVNTDEASQQNTIAVLSHIHTYWYMNKPTYLTN